MIESALKKVVDQAYGPMTVGRIIVLRGADDRIRVELQDDTGWLIHEIGPVKVLPGDTLTIECPKEQS